MQMGATNKLLVAALVLAGVGLETGYGWGGGNNRIYRKEITLSVATTSANYQLLVTLATTNFNYAHAATNGGDLLFTGTSDGALSHWVENWDTNGDSKVWVRVAASGTSTLRLYYGDPTVTDGGTAASNIFARVIGDTNQSLKGSWHFDEAAGASAYDSSGNGYTGTASGTPAGPTITSGKFGNARLFNGITQTVAIGSAPLCNFTNSDFSTEAWIRSATNPAAMRIVIARYNGVPLWYNNVSGSAFGSRLRSVGDISTSGGSIATGVWTHVVVTYNRTGSMTIYLNGTNSGSANISSMSSESMWSPNNLNIGSSSAGTPSSVFNGEIDEAKVYGVALSTDEITDLYTNYGYTTTNYPGRVLVRQSATPAPSASLGSEKRLNRGTIFSTR